MKSVSVERFIDFRAIDWNRRGSAQTRNLQRSPGRRITGSLSSDIARINLANLLLVQEPCLVPVARVDT